ncbi:hypothetical protein POSPLADRAFT_1142692, partial [Postia placenta MAD-698-R-SB12]
VEYESVFFNGSLAHPSEYRGPPSPYIDAAWGRLTGHVLPVRITDDTLTRIGMAHRPSIVSYREEDGGGYVAIIEVSHQIHCLDMLRRHTYFDYYEPIKHSIPPGDAEFYRIHLDHCIEMLRQRILCTGDVGMITFDWVKGHKKPYPNFNTLHVCRKLDNILDWSARHAVDITVEDLARTGEVIDLAEVP